MQVKNILISAPGPFSVCLKECSKYINNQISLSIIIIDKTFYDKNLSKERNLRGSFSNIYFDWNKYKFLEKLTHIEIYKKVQEIERKLNYPVSKIINADRRYSFGLNCKLTQNYASPFKYIDLLRNFLRINHTLEIAFKQSKPEKCINFGSANITDILLELYANYYSINFKQIKATKISNFISSNPSGLSNEYLKCETKISNNIEKTKAIDDYILQQKHKKVVYEGSINQKKQNFLKKEINSFLNLILLIPKISNYLIKKRFMDLHVMNPFTYFILKEIIIPFRTLKMRNLIKLYSILEIKKIKKSNYLIFYPLHFEPEISLQIYGTENQNQIELIRKLSLGSPIDSKILIKEHPRSIGHRKISYYQKLLEIPKVVLCDPNIISTEIIDNSDLICIISGSIAGEALFKKKPVIFFGDSIYDGISDKMIRKVDSLKSIFESIKFLKNNFTYNENILKKRLKALLKNSERINLYTELLQKENRYSDKQLGREINLSRLAKLVSE